MPQRVLKLLDNFFITHKTRMRVSLQSEHQRLFQCSVRAFFCIRFPVEQILSLKTSPALIGFVSPALGILYY